MIRGVRGRPGIGRAIGAQGRALGTGSVGRDVTNAIALPGDLELRSMCANARKIAGWCDLARIGLDDEPYDPDPPYIWDVLK